MVDEEAKRIASQCRHYAMCKIDFLGTGLCPAAAENHYVGYFPQGRMDIYAALAQGKIPVTEALVDIARTCTLCGICDRQCYFVTQLRPLKVARALKQLVEEYLLSHKPVQVKLDPTLKRLRAIVGERWASNDPAHLIGYANDPCPLSLETIPRYVVLPGSKEEVVGVMKLCNRLKLPFAIRGNGSSVMGFVLSQGLVLDMNRMKEIRFDPENWCVHVGPGVSAFDLQQEAEKRGYRVNTAEPSANVCANLMCSGIFSLFSHSYGTCADNLVDAQFVSPKGRIFYLHQKDAPNLFAFEKKEVPPPGVCVEASVKLQPALEDEQGVAVPFASLREALLFARELARRRIGTGLGVLGGEYLSSFMAPTRELADAVRERFTSQLGIESLVLVLGDRHAMDAVGARARAVWGAEFMRTLLLGLPNLIKNEWLEVLSGLEGDQPLYEVLAREEMLPLLKAALDPSPHTFASAVDEDLRDFFASLYSRPQMADLLWLNSFRIISSRMGRAGHVVAFILYVPLDRPQ
ncbi:MAG: FAD-binding protein, partial [candidate division NC10 bacterium]|nr:FAD-binding protein [candidate division NC10 bacterium]